MRISEKKKLRNSLKLIANTSFIVFISIFLSKILTYAYRIVIARNYGPDTYGAFSLAVMLLGWFAIFSRLGLPEGLYRYIPYYRGKKDKNKVRFLIKKSISLIILSSVVLGFVLFFTSNFIAVKLFKTGNLIFFLKIFAIILPFYVLFDIFLVILISFEKIIWRSFIFNIFQNLVRLVALSLIIFFGLNSNSIAFTYALGTFSGFLLAFFVIKLSIKDIFKSHTLSVKERRDSFKKLFNYSWPLLFFGIIFSIFNWTDSFIIGIMTGVSQVGFYNAAVPLAMLLMITPQLFVQLFFPIITKHFSENEKNLSIIRELSKQVSKWIFIVNLPLLILILIFPGVFINFFFGKEYLIAENSLRFLAVGALFNSVFIISNNLISMLGKSKIILLDIIIASIINMLLNILLVQKYSITGAAIATMVSLIFLNLLFLFQAKKYTSIIPLRRKMIKIFLISLIPAIFLIFLRNQLRTINFSVLILSGCLFIFTYILLIFVFSGLDKNDLFILNLFLNKIKNSFIGFKNLEIY